MFIDSPNNIYDDVNTNRSGLKDKPLSIVVWDNLMGVILIQCLMRKLSTLKFLVRTIGLGISCRVSHRVSYKSGKLGGTGY